jgi:hypothetical protein
VHRLAATGGRVGALAAGADERHAGSALRLVGVAVPEWATKGEASDLITLAEGRRVEQLTRARGLRTAPGGARHRPARPLTAKESHASAAVAARARWRPRRHLGRRVAIALGLLAAANLAGCALSRETLEPPSRPARVTHVVDGDTIATHDGARRERGSCSGSTRPSCTTTLDAYGGYRINCGSIVFDRRLRPRRDWPSRV